MDPIPFLRGLALGVAVAAPVGPMSLLCMRRTLAAGFPAGILSGLGVATADGLYAAFAATGLVAVADVLLGGRLWLQLAGGAALLYLGVATLRARPAERPAAAGAAGLAGMYASTLALTLANPATVISFAALFAAVGLGGAGTGPAHAAALVAGVFLGSACWWLTLTAGLALARRRLPARLLRAVNALSGVAIAVFGVVAIAGALLSL